MNWIKNSKIAIFLALVQLESFAIAEDKITVKGKITAYDLEEKTLSVEVEKKEILFVVQDSKALGMLDDQLVVGDEVRVRYLVQDGKNVINSGPDLKSTRPGC
ncbi:conserved hypothetical protein [Gammaproteobacteria bacterium]